MQAKSGAFHCASASRCPSVLSITKHTVRARLAPLCSASTDVAAVSNAPVTYSFDPNSSSSSSPASSSSSSSTIASTVTSTKLALLEQIAALDRGTLATHADKENIERLVKLLEASGSGSDPFTGTPAVVEGRWELLYTNKEVFRASPFFLAFQNGLVQNKELAEAIFKFTDAIPGAEIGTAYQTVSLLSGSLISEVVMTVWPGFSGTVVTSSRLAVTGPNTLGLNIESTRVTGSSFSPFLDGVSVPVEQLISQLRGDGATAATYEITFVDSNLRVTRAGDQLMLHRRVLATS